MTRTKRKEVAQIKDKEKANALALLRERFDLPTLAAVIQRGSSDSSYELKLEDGRIIVIGTSFEIHQQAKVRARLFDADATLKKYHADDWAKVLLAVRQAVEVVETMTEADELRGYVLGILGVQRSRLDDYDDVASVDFGDEDKTALLKTLANRKHRGFYDYKSGVVYLPLARFVEFLSFNSGRRWTQREAIALLTRHDFVYRQKSVRYTDAEGESKVFNVGTFWTSPESYYLKGDS